ncbi:MAG: carboxypeptidase regulatory-like domain-containing protein [Terriglobales bacterium]|jgi:hypothetical protein
MKATRVLLVGILLTISQLALGQGSATGDLHVTVKDQKGGVVTDATVTVRDVAKGLERTGSGDGQGGYSVRQLAPGTYTVSVAAAGFATVEAPAVNITVGQIAELPIGLTVAAGKEVVEVTSQAELVETSRSSTTDTIGERRIENLPINGRNYINFTLTDSQVQRDNAPSLGGAAPTSGLNMSGQRGRSNLVNVDGTDATDNSTNGERSTVSQEDVQEFQIITNSYAAEYGRAAGGVVNIITRSGSNAFHGDVYGYLRNRNFQAVNPFSTTSNPAYTRVQAGTAFGGPIVKDKTFYFFSYETTRRHETGFSSIGQGNFGLIPFNTANTAGGAVPLPFGTIQITPQQAGFLAGLTPAEVGAIGLTNLENYEVLVGASSGQAINGQWPTQLVQGLTGGLLPGWAGFPTSCVPGDCPATAIFGLSNAPSSFQTLASQEGNFPVFEGTSLYSFRIDHNISAANRLSLSVHASPSTVTGIEVSGQDQPFGQNAYSRTSQTTYRDVAGIVQDTWTLGNNKVNEFRFQYARRGLEYFYNTKIPGGSDPAVNIPGFAYIGREPYSYIRRTEERYQFMDNLAWTIGHHDTKFGGDFNYLPLTATFPVNYGGVYDFGSLSASDLSLPTGFPGLSAVQAYGAGVPQDFIQGLGSPSDSFHNIPIGVFWQDSWRARHNLTVNYGVRYDVEKPPSFTPPQGLALPAYNLLGLQKGIQADKNNIQPRLGIAWDPYGDGKTVVRGSYGIFYDHPLLGLYFLGDASDGSSSGQLAFGPGSVCAGAGNPGNLNAVATFQGLLPAANGSPASPCSPATSTTALGLLNYAPNQQRFSCPNGDQNCGLAIPPSSSIFLTQNYLNPATFLPLGFQPFGYPQGKNFVYAYSEQANLTIERDLGNNYSLSLAYNFNGGHHLNRPINANTVRGDLLVNNYNAAVAAGQTPSSPLTVGTGLVPCGSGSLGPWVSAPLMNFFRPGGLNPSFAAFYGQLAPGCLALAQQIVGSLKSQGFNTACDPATYAGCVPFGDMDANYSNGSSVYHGLTANLRKRFSQHYEFQASYTWSHAIDDSTDLQSTLTPQDSYFPSADRSTSLFNQKHRFVFNGVYQSGKLSGTSFAKKFFSNWTIAPLIEFGSGRPFNIITSSDDNFQLSSLTVRPNVVPAGTPVSACGYAPVASKYSPTGYFQESCFLTNFNGTLASLDGNLGRNAGVTPWTAFNDVRLAKRISFNERYSMDLITDMFNIANVYNVAAVSPLFANAGQATAAYDPRQFQFAMKIYW